MQLGEPTSTNGEVLPDDGSAEWNSRAGQAVDVVGSVLSGAELAAEIAGLATTTMFLGLGGILLHGASFYFAIAAAHAQEIEQAQHLGLRIAIVGLDRISRGDYEWPEVVGAELHTQGRPLMQAQFDQLTLHCTQVPDSEIIRQMLAVSAALADDINGDLARRVTALYEQAAAHGIQRAQVDQQLPQIRGEYLRRIHRVLVQRVGAASRAD